MMLFPGCVYSQGIVGVVAFAFAVLLGVTAFAVQIFKQLQRQMRKRDSFSSPRDSCLGSLGKPLQ